MRLAGVTSRVRSRCLASADQGRVEDSLGPFRPPLCTATTQEDKGKEGQRSGQVRAPKGKGQGGQSSGKAKVREVRSQEGRRQEPGRTELR